MGRAMVARLGLGLLLLALLLPTQAAKCTCGPDLLGATSSVLPVIRSPCKPFLAVRAEISHLPLFRDKGEIITCPTGLCIFREISVIYSNHTTPATPASNPSHNTSTTPSPANTTTKASGDAMRSTASVFVISLALLHLYC